MLHDVAEVVVKGLGFLVLGLYILGVFWRSRR